MRQILSRVGAQVTTTERAVLHMVWRWLVLGAVIGVVVAVAWARELAFWTFVAGGVFGLIIAAAVLVLIALDAIPIKRRD